MILIYDISNGKIFSAVWDKDKLSFSPSINTTVGIFTVDEIQDNKELLVDLERFVGRIDIVESGKYYIDSEGDLSINEGWEELTYD